MLIPFETVVRRCRPITGILHVGAHLAEELKTYEEYGVNSVVWVEADPRKAEWISKHKCHPPKHRVICCAATNEDGPVTFRVTNNDGMSSSLLPLKEHLNYYPHIVESEQITVEGKRLGPLLDSLEIQIGSPGLNFLNTDVQGAELLVLKGLGDKVGLFDSIYTEINTSELYSGAVQLPVLDDYLKGFGFVRIETEMWHHDNWGDALYIRM